jgi:hypothetical protein
MKSQKKLKHKLQLLTVHRPATPYFNHESSHGISDGNIFNTEGIHEISDSLNSMMVVNTTEAKKYFKNITLLMISHMYKTYFPLS